MSAKFQTNCLFAYNWLWQGGEKNITVNALKLQKGIIAVSVFIYGNTSTVNLHAGRKLVWLQLHFNLMRKRALCFSHKTGFRSANHRTHSVILASPHAHS